MESKNSKKPGTSGMAGQLYEIKLIIFTLMQALEACENGSILDFFIDSNLEEAGKFDDVIIEYRRQNGTSVTLFIQAKHREDASRKLTSEKLLSAADQKFGLRSYMNSYFQIRDNSSSDESRYILYTNTEYEETGVEIKMFQEENNEHLDLSTSKGLPLRIAHKDNKAVYEALQCTADLEDIVKSIHKMFEGKEDGDLIELNMTIPAFKKFHSYLAENVFENCSSGMGTFRTSFLEGSEKIVSKEVLVLRTRLFDEFEKNSTTHKTDWIEKFKNKRLKVPNKFWKKNNDQYGKPKLIVSQEETTEFLKKLRLFFCQSNEEDLEKRVLEKLEEKYGDESKGVYSDVRRRVENWWKTKDRSRLTREDDWFVTAYRKIAAEKLEVLITTKKKQLSTFGVKFDQSAILETKYLLCKEKIMYVQCTSKLLCQLKLLQILNDYNVSFWNIQTLNYIKEMVMAAFQGPLNCLVLDYDSPDGTLLNIIKAYEEIAMMNTSKVLIIIDHLRMFPESSFDMNFAFEHLDQESQSRLMEKCIVVQGNEIKLNTLTHPTNFLDEDMIVKLIENVEINIGTPLWEMHENKPVRISRRLNNSVREISSKEFLKDLPGLAMVSGEAGLGKSTLLSQLAEMKSNHVWKVKVDFTSIKKHFEKLKETPDLLDRLYVIDLLKESLKLKTAFEENFFEACINNNIKMLIMLDGFDEISSNLRIQALELAKAINVEAVGDIVITSRPQEVDLLKQELNTKHYILMPFSVEEQLECMQKVYSLPCLPDNYKESFDEEFLRIPLHLDMLVEYWRDNRDSQNSNVSIVKLYEYLVSKKYRTIYCEEKQSITDDDLIESGFEAFLEHHKRAAFDTIFHELHTNLLWKDSLPKGERWRRKTGVISRYDLDGTPVFVHRTFAEYFVALALVDFYADISIRGSLQNFLIKNARRHSEWMYFFNKIMAKNWMHEAIVDEKTSLYILTKLAMEEDASAIVNATDKAGRTPLHLAIQYGDLDVMVALLNCGADPTAIDDLMRMTPLEYALVHREASAFFVISSLDSVDIEKVLGCTHDGFKLIFLSGDILIDREPRRFQFKNIIEYRKREKRRNALNKLIDGTEIKMFDIKHCRMKCIIKSPDRSDISCNINLEIRFPIYQKELLKDIERVMTQHILAGDATRDNASFYQRSIVKIQTQFFIYIFIIRGFGMSTLRNVYRDLNIQETITLTEIYSRESKEIWEWLEVACRLVSPQEEVRLFVTTTRTRFTNIVKPCLDLDDEPSLLEENIIHVE